VAEKSGPGCIADYLRRGLRTTAETRTMEGFVVIGGARLKTAGTKLFLMPLQPPLAEDLLNLLEKYPDLTTVQRALVRSAAAYLVQDEMERTDSEEEFDARLKMQIDEYHLLPDRIELWDGIPRPKHWATPNRLDAVKRERERDGRGLP
jgi:hypothetical protein